MNLVSILLPVVALLQPAGTPKLAVKLYAAHDAIQPGGQTELAVEIEVEEGWHVYDPIILDTGAPTTVSFEVPPGVTFGELRFPTPYLAEEFDLEYLAHEGRIVVLTTLELAADTDLESLTIKAKVDALACKELCIPIKAEATLTLDVTEQTPAAANEKLFEDARDELPPPLAKADYIKGSRVLISHTQVPVGGAAELVAVVRVERDHHIQDRDPGVEGFIASRLFVEERDGINFDPDRETWPAPRVHDVQGLGRVREQSGEVVIRVPFVIDDAEFKPGPIRLNVLFQYQACRDEGACYPPIVAGGAVEFEVIPAGEPGVANTDPILEKLGPLPAKGSGEDGRAGTAGPRSTPPIAIVLLFAFLGGVILNIMPCVLPVISLKIFGFVQQAGDDPQRVFRMGLVYAAGIMASFAVIAVLMVTLGLAWGGLMQQPGFLIGLSAVVFAFALSLLGVFEIQLPGAAMDVAEAATRKEGYAGAFFNGVMATLLATPCVGPFLGSAVGVLAQLPPLVAGSGIMVVGLGLALPYVLLTTFPGWLRFLPKPGPWMVVFKQVVGFILVAVVIWLLSILIEMVDHGRVLGTLGLLCAVGIACWLLGKVTLSDSFRRTATIWVAALGLIVGGGWTSFRVFGLSEKIPWQEWEPGIAERLAEEGYTVYVDYTAKWCLICQANKTFVLNTDRVAGMFDRLKIYPVKADFSEANPDMQQELRGHDRDGVPLNIVLPAGKPDQVIVLPEILTTRIVLDALAKAGPSRNTPPFWRPK